ncbi:NAD-dependent malic enzyme [Acidaminococcus sp. NSJ-142]|jgi:malate dehydrogenase (oxaloacetate-decarboxylating)|nr:NAD-dependent malic enzyme [Acidaminococcus hominis]MCH4096791.1 NAD-dependent malic enzyme [Acidaminococcus provencensis]RHJ98193.1 NAD-dependent malic enzyme [Acidaminococcus sp. AM05-11]
MAATKMGYDLLNDPFLNKGTAFSLEERRKYGLVGILPPHVETLELQAQQAYENVCERPNRAVQRHYLMKLFSRNRTLFFYLFSHHLEQLLPILYAPGVAESVKQYSELFTTPQNAVYLSIDAMGDIEEALRNGAAGRDIELIVVTDGESILGIGDWGTNGVSISTGKILVYTAAAGIDPAKVLPVVLDAGTSRQSLIDDPLYLGLHHKRIVGAAYDTFVDRFVRTAEKLFPNLYIHFEDFGRENAARLLDQYANQFAVYNDDIEGTGAVTLAAILGALKISGQKLTDQKFLCFGAGTSGMGIVRQVYEEMLLQGLTPQEAQDRFYLVDQQGLLFEDSDALTPQQNLFTRKRTEFADSHDLDTLEKVVKAIHPTILVGCSTVGGAFTESIVKEMAAHTERPIVFPLSNPTELAEAKAADLIAWTEGRALVATGTASQEVGYQGVKYQIGQANNSLVFPGMGLAVTACHAKCVSQGMLAAAAHALADEVKVENAGASVLPPVTHLQDFTVVLAQKVAQRIVEEGVNQKAIADPAQAVLDSQWTAEYKEL